MEIEERKKIIKKALIDSFVNDSKAYKNTISFINSDFVNSNINFKYSYDEFCIEFLNQTLINLDDIDIFNYDEYDQFYNNFWKFNLYNLQCMLNTKLDTLGYKYDDYYNNSDIKQQIKNKYKK